MKVNELYSQKSEDNTNQSDNSSAENNQNQNNENNNNESASDWMDSFLETRGIQDGNIEYGDGDIKKFSELDDKDKISILDQLTNQSSDYTEDESGIINTLRDKDISFDELIDMEVTERLKAIDNDLSVLNRNTESLSNEEAHYAYLRRKDPKRDTEEIQEEIELAKDMPDYEDSTKKMKDFLVNQDKLEKEEIMRKDKERSFEKDEALRRKFANSVVDMNNIGGWLVDEKTKDAMLKDIFEYDEQANNGNTKFVNDLLSDPKKMMKAKFFLDYGEEKMNNTESDLQKEIDLAYTKGYNQALNGGGNNTFTQSRDTKKPDTEAKDTDNDDNKPLTVAQLHARKK